MLSREIKSQAGDHYLNPYFYNDVLVRSIDKKNFYIDSCSLYKMMATKKNIHYIDDKVFKVIRSVYDTPKRKKIPCIIAFGINIEGSILL